ncbi:DUF2142 domain-containing protein [Lactococcus termiticola]|uniref:Membrane protein n=1 Tax=Lactococcus termiticola TaxID=2169526 RepID=A0A2R5HJ65_9LACT|nr:DUF2142 domain-containing protein [Lactococcus termiticola]GBG96550.1 membrane protein [Lactococcus termiticola]
MTQTRKKKLRIEKLFLMMAIVFGLLTVFIQPIFSAPDEAIHFRNAYSIFHRDADGMFKALNQNNILVSDYDPFLHKGSGLTTPISEAYQTPYRRGTFIKDYFVTTVPEAGRLSLHLSFSSIKWLPQALGILLASFIHPSIGLMYVLGRLFNLAVYIGIIYFAIKKAKLGQWVMAAVALLPASIAQAASLSYDVSYFAVVFLVFSAFTNLWVKREKLKLRHLFYGLGLLVALLIPKSAVLLLFLYFLTIPSDSFGAGRFKSFLDKFWAFWYRHKWLSGLLILIFALAAVSFELRQYGGLVRGLQALFNTFFRPDLYKGLDSDLTSGIIGNFASLTYRLPEWLVIIDFAFLFALMLNEKEVRLDRRIALSGFLIYIGVILMTAVYMISWMINNLGFKEYLVSLGNQGRYYTPFLILLTPFFIKLKKYVRFEISEQYVKKAFIGLMSFNLIYFLILSLLVNYAPSFGASFFLDFVQWLKGLV